MNLAKCSTEKQLNYLEPLVFDIRTRIFTIDQVLQNNKSRGYCLVGYSDLTKKSQKFSMLKATKFSNLTKLPPCKTIIVKIVKFKNGKQPLGISMPVDKVLQKMFFKQKSKMKI